MLLNILHCSSLVATTSPRHSPNASITYTRRGPLAGNEQTFPRCPNAGHHTPWKPSKKPYSVTDSPSVSWLSCLHTSIRRTSFNISLTGHIRGVDSRWFDAPAGRNWGKRAGGLVPLPKTARSRSSFLAGAGVGESTAGHLDRSRGVIVSRSGGGPAPGAPCESGNSIFKRRSKSNRRPSRHHGPIGFPMITPLNAVQPYDVYI